MLSPGWILTFCWNPWLSVVGPKNQVSGTGVATGNISIETSCMDYWSGQGKVSLIDLTPKKLIIKGASKPLIHSKRSLKLFSFPATRCMQRVRRHRQLCRPRRGGWLGTGHGKPPTLLLLCGTSWDRNGHTGRWQWERPTSRTLLYPFPAGDVHRAFLSSFEQWFLTLRAVILNLQKSQDSSRCTSCASNACWLFPETKQALSSTALNTQTAASETEASRKYIFQLLPRSLNKAQKPPDSFL